MLADIIFAALVLIFILSGRRVGLVKSVLGMFSVLICGALTVVVYNYADKTGAVMYVSAFLESYIPGDTYVWLLKTGVAGYAVNAVIAVVIYIGVRLLYRFTVGIVDLAVPSFLNKLLGGVFGAVKALALTLAVLAVIYSVRHSFDVSSATDIIAKSRIVGQLYENNILLKLI